MDDWGAEADEDRARRRDRARASAGARAPDPARSATLAERLRRRRATRSWSPGPTSTPAAAGTPRWRWPRRSACPCGPRPATGGGRIGFPEGHPSFLGVLPPAIGAGRPRRCRATTWCSSSAPRCSPTTPTSPARCCAEGTTLVAITSDPGEAARAPMGDAIVGDVALALRAAGRRSCASPTATRPSRGPSRGDRRPRARSAERLGGDGRAGRRLAATTGSSCSSRRRARWRCATGCGCRRPGSYYFSASGGLGLRDRRRRRRPARPARRGRSCACWARARRSTGSPRCGRAAGLQGAGHVPGPAQRRVHDPQVVRRRSSRSTGAPGLDLPGLDVAAVARGYGVPARRTSAGARSSREALRDGDRRRDGPRLVQVAGRVRDVAGSDRHRRHPDTIAPEPPGPAPDRAPDWVAAGTPEPLRSRLVAALGADRVLSRRSTSIRYASDASPYRLIPAGGGRPPRRAGHRKLLRCATELGLAGHLPRRRHQPQRPEPDRRDPRRRPSPLAPGAVEDDGARVRVQPGVVLGHANRLLARRGRSSAPTPPPPTSPASAG